MVPSIVLLAYAALLLALGAFVSRRVRRVDQFYVAGRQLGPGLLFSTLLAANIGAGSTVGAAGLGYRDGLSAWWWVGSAGIGSAILACTVGPRIWSVARKHNLFTVGDYLELRYDRKVRSLAAILISVGSLCILAGQYIAVAWILEVTLGFSKTPGCLIAALITAAYFTAGGLHASARIHVVQLTVKLVGFALAFAYLCGLGGGQTWFQAVHEGVGAGFSSYGSILGPGLPGILRYLALLAPSFIVSPGILQKVFGARDAKAVGIGVGLNAAGLLAFAMIPPLMGAMAHRAFPLLPISELALPTLLLKSLPLWLGGLLLGAIFSAELSAADAVLFMLSTALGRDLYQRCYNPLADDRQLLRVTRGTAVFCAVLAALVANFLPTVVAALTIFYTLLTAALFLPLVAGLYCRQVTARAAFATMLVSVAVTVAGEFGIRGGFLWKLPSSIIGMTAGGLVMAIMTVRKPARAEGTEV